MSKKGIFRGLTEEEIAYYYTLLNEEITNFNCGTLCAPDNDGEPFCCKVENAVPFLYKEEFQYLQKRSELWSVWEPKTKHEIKLKKETETEDTIFCKCKGVSYCERENRSISCRTFPLEPYLDKRDVFIALVFMQEFSHGCPLTQRPEDIRQDFVDNHFIFWEKLMLRKPDEFETYKKSSRRYRNKRERTGIPFPLLFPSHLKDKDYILKYV